MASISFFFPKRLQGNALALQAGMGNFGVWVVQFVTPWIIGFVFAGSLLATRRLHAAEGATTSIWLQNAAASACRSS